MTTLYMTKGLPACGKTTWAKEKLAEHPGGYKRVNKDELRSMMDNGKWSSSNEKFVLGISRAIVDSALGAGKHVIVDDTNLAPKHEVALRECAKKRGAAFEVVDLTHVSLEECIARDRKRPNYVGESVIRDMHRRYLAKSVDPVEFVDGLPDAVLVDIDGTVAQMNGRGPFDWSRVGEDLPRRAVIRAVMHYGYPCIFMSGRDESCRSQTEAWLTQHCGGAQTLYMRQSGDQRKDTIVKREMYETHIQGKFNVRGIWDDRLQVCRMWKDLGLGDRLFRVGPVDEDDF